MEKNNKVFISYCQKKCTVVEFLEDEILKTGLRVRRDIRNLDKWDSIIEFMNSMKKDEYIILVITKEYLLSINCMYEATIAMKTCKEKVAIFLTKELEIYEYSNKEKIITYWINYEEKGCESDKKKVQIIKKNINDLLEWITDSNNPKASDYYAFVYALKQKIQKQDIFDDDLSDMLEDLRFSKNVVISEFIEDCFREQYYTYVGFDFINVGLGYTFVFTLKDSNEEIKKIQVDNVNKVKRGNEGGNFVKYYFECVDMQAVKRQKDMDDFGRKYSEEELRKNKTHRIIINF